MPEIYHAVQYYLFMKWFKKTHPRLYYQYKGQILVPVQSYEISAAMNAVAPQDRKLLQDVINEYYTKVAD